MHTTNFSVVRIELNTKIILDFVLIDRDCPVIWKHSADRSPQYDQSDVHAAPKMMIGGSALAMERRTSDGRG